VEHKFCHEENEIVHPNRVYRQIADCFAEIDKTCPPFRAPEQSWFPGIQVVTAHEGSAEDGLDGLFFSAKGGHNAESHNHNEVGNFILYYHAVPVIIDPGSESYTKITFSEKRYTLWYTQSCYHNVPAINGMDQAPGFEHRAKDVSFSHDGNSTRFSLELAEVYPAEAGIKSYRRDFVFRKGEGLLLTDTWSFKEGGAPVELNLMCYEKPEIDREQVLLSGCVSLSFDPSLFALTVDTVPLADKKMCRDWDKDVLFRLRLAGKDSGPSGTARLRFTGL
jgi:hypothetical protein